MTGRTRHRHPGAERVRCPADDWEFTPRFTDGVCPLCGYRPPGRAVAGGPLLDAFWLGLLTLLAVSVLMGVLVVRAYLG